MRYLPALILDAVLVLVFAAIGRASHAEDPGGFLLTAWPFLVALLIGHAVAALLPARPRRPWSISWGAVVWAITVVGGMLLRVASGQTAQVAFIIVATLTLGVFLLGWRATTAFLRRRRSGNSDDAAADVDSVEDEPRDEGASSGSAESWDVPAPDRESEHQPPPEPASVRNRDGDGEPAAAGEPQSTTESAPKVESYRLRPANPNRD